MNMTKTNPKKPGKAKKKPSPEVGKTCTLIRELRTVSGKRFKVGTQFTIVRKRGGLYDLESKDGYPISHVRPNRVTIA